jgi:uncharacterized protein (TIGR02391 family)
MPVNSIVMQYPTPEQLVSAPPVDVERVLLRHVVEYCSDGMHPWITRDTAIIQLFEPGGYAHSLQAKADVSKVISRAWKKLEDRLFIEEPDTYNGKNGFRKPSEEGRQANAAADYAAVSARSKFTRDMFHPDLPDASWNAFSSGDYDSAVFEAFKAVEALVRKRLAATDFGAALMKKAFDPTTGPLRDEAASATRRKARCDLFTGAFDAIRNPKAHNDPTIVDTLVAVEEMMTAGVLRRIVDST